ncbi:ATP-binding cassette domain-containing protein [Clostridium scatologenes]|uniref:UvrABC system protein A n=1 Tax=Clostridium scatologenes TaxID=1548 RepID=A0A0E3M5X3_CLOSL|nr:excinuclease ABC subunit UvrA [Clostridium scatologenes]AKA68957.1 ABC transporter related protein [Clostridium scatologenes]
MHIHLKGLRQNNLKNISISIPKEKIVVFTGVSGSGKSSIVFDTIAAESQRQMNETYPAFIRGRLPKYEKPHVDYIDNLTASVIVDQTRLGGNARSTVGTISDLYASLRLLFSRIGIPKVGTASYFSFNDPKGMCKKCAGIGKVAVIDMEAMLDKSKSWMEGCVKDSLYAPGSWYWKQYKESGIFDMEKPLNEYSKEEYNLLIYGSRDGKSEQEYPKIEGLFNHYTRLYLKRDTSNMSKHTKKKSENLIKEELCPACMGKRLNEEVLNCKIEGYSIADMCEMEFVELLRVLKTVDDKRTITIVQSICDGLKRMIDIGLPYLHLNRESSTLSGGEAQRVKLVRYMGSSLTGMTYIFDEPSTGLHPRDVNRMNQLLVKLRDKGNTVLVVEHDKDVISIADEIIDVGPCAGKEGGNIVFQGSYKELLQAHTLTSKAMKINVPLKKKVRKVQGYFPIENAKLHNLKDISVNIPKNVMTVVTGVAGSGKSTLISQVFAEIYKENVVKVDQGAITATNRSTPATFLGFFDEIRKLFASENGVDEGLFSFNSKGACPVCKGKGVIVTELVFMDPVITECETCSGSRYSEEALSYRYKEKNIVEVLSMTVEEALIFFEDKKIRKTLQAMKEVGLSYMTLGQPLQTLSGGERQRMKLAKYINKKGNIYILDEPTTGLHISDINKLLQLFEKMVDRGNTVIIIEHNIEVMKQADWIIDIGPDGGKNGGQVVFEGTPKEMLEKSNTITAKCLRKEIAG